MKNRDFDCVEMKRAAQERIRAQVDGMTPDEEIAFFRKGGDAFEQAIKRASQGRQIQASASRGRTRKQRLV